MGRDDRRLAIGVLCGIALALAVALVIGRHVQPPGTLAQWSRSLASQYWPHMWHFLHSVARWLISWHWGALTTATLAVTAIIVSIVTLRRNTAQFRQQRLDARDDKLRTEIANLSAALTQRIVQLNMLVSRTGELTQSLKEAGVLDEDELRLRYVWGGKIIFAQEVSGLYTQIDSHATTITMLTADPAITELVDRISTAATEERQYYERRLGLYLEGPLLPKPEEKEELDCRNDEVVETISVARQELVNLGRERWGTS